MRTRRRQRGGEGVFDNIKNAFTNVGNNISAATRKVTDVFGTNKPLFQSISSPGTVATLQSNDDEVISIMKSKLQDLESRINTNNKTSAEFETKLRATLEELQKDTADLRRKQILLNEYVNLNNVLIESPNISENEIQSKISEIRSEAMSDTNQSKISFSSPPSVSEDPFSFSNPNDASEELSNELPKSEETDTFTESPESTAATDESTAATDESTAASDDESTAATDESTAATDESTAATDESTAATDESTAATNESTAATDESTAATDESTAATDESTAATDESTAATEPSEKSPDMSALSPEEFSDEFKSPIEPKVGGTKRRRRYAFRRRSLKNK